MNKHAPHLKKVILYYCFTPLEDPKAVALWQRQLAESLSLKGRIIISKHGINGTLGGDMADLKKYVKLTRKYPVFAKIDFKWSKGTGNDFPALQVRVRKELVGFGNPDIIQVGKNGVKNTGVHLHPYQVDQLVKERGDEVIFFDGRNAYEAKIGQFKGAVIPDIQTSHDFIEEIRSGKYDHIKERPIVAYCTGGVRCEILSAIMIENGFKEVYQIDGGIVKYGEKLGNDSHWDGSLYVFDNRMVYDFSEEPEIIGECVACSAPTKLFRNCHSKTCHQLILLCDPCAALPSEVTCNHPINQKRRNREFVG